MEFFVALPHKKAPDPGTRGFFLIKEIYMIVYVL